MSSNLMKHALCLDCFLLTMILARSRINAAAAFLPTVNSRTIHHHHRTKRILYSTSPSSATSDFDAVAVPLGYEEEKQKPRFRIFYNDVYEVQLPKNHRFPMNKYRQVREMVQQSFRELPEEEQHRVHYDFQISPLASEEELITTHSPEYVKKVMTGDLTEMELRNVGFPWSEENVKRSTSSVGGTVAAAKFVCDHIEQQRQRGGSNSSHSNSSNSNNNNYSTTIAPWAAHVAGGTHHAFCDRGEGFCVFSDIAVAANVILQNYDWVQRILILDLDVHQGNGNAVLFQNRPEVVTVSIHCSANYFSEKQTSDLDIELPPDSSDQTYLMTLRHWLKQIKQQQQQQQQDGGKFDLVFFQAGVDILKDDRLGRMSVSQKGIERRNELVFDFVRELNVPFVITMGGGYPRTDDWAPILQAHASVYKQARQYLSNLVK